MKHESEEQLNAPGWRRPSGMTPGGTYMQEQNGDHDLPHEGMSASNVGRHYGTACIVSLFVAVVALGAGVHWLGCIGNGFFAFVLLRFVGAWGKTLPLTHFLTLLAGLQWIVAPTASYLGWCPHYKYYMYVPQERYFLLVVPGVLVYALGLHLTRYRQAATVIEDLRRRLLAFGHPQLHAGVLLLVAGPFFSMLRLIMPPALSFPLFILSQMGNVGVIYVLFTDYPQKYLVAAAGLMLGAAGALTEGMFHNMILWVIFIGLYIGLAHQWRWKRKVVALAAISLLVLAVQAVKLEYRRHLYAGNYGGSKAALFVNLLADRVLADDFQSETDTVVATTWIRLNQGWIISRIQEMVPNYLPYAQGDTIVEAVKATFMPRILFPNKPIVGGRKNFYRFTGYALSHSTSMGISLIGEGYGNFGIVGAWVFMFVMGAFFSAIINLWFRFSSKDPVALLWLPLVFLHVVKAETELLNVLNFLVKSAIVVLAVLISRRFFVVRRQAPGTIGRAMAESHRLGG